MSGPASAIRLRMPSRPLLRADDAVLLTEAPDASIRRRLGWIWGLLVVNVMAYTTKSPILHMPTAGGKVITQGALGVALVLALTVNRRVLLRPNLFLLLMTVLCVTSAMMSIRGYYGLGSMFRAGRFVMVMAVLWLISPWYGRSDLLLFRFHRRAIYAILGIVLLGVLIDPGVALHQTGTFRLGGALWPIPATQVADYSAILAGTTVILRFAGLMRPRAALAVTVASTAICLLTHTRTAVVGLLVGLLVAAASLYLCRKRVRKVVGTTIVLSALLALSFAPFLSSWFLRGQTQHQLLSLTGRETVWSQIVAQPRSEVHTVFGYGMSNDSFNGLPIDSSWYSAYVDQGLFGDIVDGAVLLALVLVAVMSPRGPRRAIALFLVVYCFVASFTETGLGQPSAYLLDLVVAMSVLVPPLGAGTRALPPGPRPVER